VRRRRRLEEGEEGAPTWRAAALVPPPEAVNRGETLCIYIYIYIICSSFIFISLDEF